MPGSEEDGKLPPKLKELTTSLLDFLSTASNEALCACVAGLVAITYFVLGRIGLVLIGVAAGIVLHATWEGGSTKDEQYKVQEAKRRKEVGLDIIQRLLDWQYETYSPKHVNHVDRGNTDVMSSAGKELDFEDFRPVTASALRNLTDAVVRDYVK